MYKVLIVDDEVLVRVGLKSILDQETLGFAVVGEASNGLEAYEQYILCKPDIVIVDIKMPKKDGLWLTREIRKNDNRTKILILTCYDDFDYVREALKNGANNYILKSEVEDEELISSLSQLKEDLEAQEKEEEDLYSLQKHFETDINVLKGKLYEDIIKENLLADEEFTARCSHLKFETEDSKFAIVSFFKDGHKRNDLSDKEKERVNKAVTNLAMDIFKTEETMFLVKENENNFETILSDKNLTEDRVRALMEAVKNAADQYFNVEISAIRTRIFADIREAYENYQQMELSIGELFYTNSSRMIHADQEIKMNNIGLLSRKKEIKQHILGCVTEEDKEGCCKNLDELERLFKEQKIYHLDVKLFYSSIINTIFERYSYCFTEIEDDYDYSYYHKRIMNLVKFKDLISLVKSFISDTIDRIGEYRRNNTKYINKTIDYIEKNYAQKILLDDLAANVNLSKHYLCSLFKKGTGITISNYVNNLRIEKAKQMILHKDYSAKELYDQLGFRDQSYFSKTFKKIVGVTVTEYKSKFPK